MNSDPSWEESDRFLLVRPITLRDLWERRNRHTCLIQPEKDDCEKGDAP